MEPNNLENKIREKLISREIQPSANSWDRLDAMLSVQEGKQKKKSFVWYYVAASLFFGLGVVFWSVNNDNETIPVPNTTTVVTTENQDLESQKKGEIQPKSSIKEDQLIEALQPNQENARVQNKVKKSTKKEKKSPKINVAVSSTLAQLETNNSITEKQQIGTANQYISAEKLLVAVEKNSQEEIVISNAKSNKSTLKVNANSLLSSVEGEIKQEYRETTFDKVKRKFNEAKSAVANRNYE